MGLGKILRNTGKYLEERWANNKEVENALKLEEARKLEKARLAGLTTEAEKELKRVDRAKKLRKTFDVAWETESNKSVANAMTYLNAWRGINDKKGIEYLSDRYHLPEDEATILYKSLSKDKLKEYEDKVYKGPYYISHFNDLAPNYKMYKKYKGYVIPNNTTGNATEAVIPGAEAISTTANTTPEVPKDPSKVGALLNNILSGAGTGTKALLKGAYDNHALYGAYVGGAGGAGYTYNNNENPSKLDYLKNALLGAALGAGAFAVPSATLRALSKNGSYPTKGSIFRAGLKYGAVPTAAVYGDPIYGYVKDALNPPVPEKPSQSNSPQMFTPKQTPANTNTNTNKEHW